MKPPKAPAKLTEKSIAVIVATATNRLAEIDNAVRGLQEAIDVLSKGELPKGKTAASIGVPVAVSTLTIGDH